MPGSPPGFFVLVGVHWRALVHTERPAGKNYARKIPKNALPLPDMAA